MKLKYLNNTVQNYLSFRPKGEIFNIFILSSAFRFLPMVEMTTQRMKAQH